MKFSFHSYWQTDYPVGLLYCHDSSVAVKSRYRTKCSSLFQDVRAHCYCPLVCTLFTRNARATSFSSARTESKTQQNIELIHHLCVNLLCEYFFLDARWPPNFFRQITSFSDSFHYTKKQKNLYVESFDYFSYSFHKDGYRCAWLSSCIYRANFTWFNDIWSKDLSNRPVYAVLNTHN